MTNVQSRKPAIQVLSSTILPSTYQIRITTCKTELQQLIQQKREQCNAERVAKQMMENAEWESKPPPPGKVPWLGSCVSAHAKAQNLMQGPDNQLPGAGSKNTLWLWKPRRRSHYLWIFLAVGATRSALFMRLRTVVLVPHLSCKVSACRLNVTPLSQWVSPGFLE